MPRDIVTTPQAAPVDFEELKKQLNMEGVDRFDAYLQLLVDASRGPWENELGITLITTTLEWTMKTWKQKTELPRPPLQQVTKVEYRDTAGTWQEVASSSYEVNTKASPGFIRFGGDYDVPDTYEDEEYPWRFTYKAGHGDEPKEIPSEIRLRVMNAIGTLFMKREDMMISTQGVDVVQLEKTMGRLIRGRNKRVRFG